MHSGLPNTADKPYKGDRCVSCQKELRGGEKVQSSFSPCRETCVSHRLICRRPKFVALLWLTDICLPCLSIICHRCATSACTCELICKPTTPCVYNTHAWGCVWEHCVQAIQCLSEKWPCVCLSDCIFFSTICMPVCLHQTLHVYCILYIQVCLTVCVCIS